MYRPRRQLAGIGVSRRAVRQRAARPPAAESPIRGRSTASTLGRRGRRRRPWPLRGAVVGKAAVIILAATLVGRILGLVRDLAVAYFFGAEADTDAFFLAYKIPYLLSLTVGGALTATFIPCSAIVWPPGARRKPGSSP